MVSVYIFGHYKKWCICRKKRWAIQEGPEPLVEAGHACAFADQLWSRPAVFVIFIPLIIHTADTHIQALPLLTQVIPILICLSIV